MRFGVLGPLEVRTDEGAAVRVPDLKVRALLADLLAHRGRVVPADRLIEDLWGADLPARPLATLQARVSQLRRTLEDAEPGARALVESRPPGYLLRVPPEAVDAGRFEALLAHDRRAALDLWRGEAFADFADAPFAAPEITRLEELRLTAVEDLAEQGAYGAELGGLVARYPLRERLRAAHMRALYRAGRQSEALSSYIELRDLLREEMGVDPDPRVTVLYESVLRQDLGGRGNLPAPLTGLVGRDEALLGVGEALAEDRLVTLIGPGGVGKTSLAVEAARRFPGEAWLVDPAAGGDVAALVSAALGLRDVPAAGLAEALRGRRVLLVLDGCERVVEPVAALTAALLRAAPDLRVLATGREPLGIAGERLWNVPPLDGDAAARLFAARASAAAPGFAVDEGNAEAVAAICRRLDGLPLALELAATRVRAMDVHELAARLDDRFRLLAAGPRDAPARQRTLRAVIDWSWDPLPEPERAVLRRLSVHADGCTLDAADRVCGGDVLDPLARLVDRSLVVHSAGRYRLLESVAAYAAERLREAGEEQQTRDRHRRYYLDLAERADPLLRGPDQRRWLDRLNAEAANLRAALDGADAGTALRLVNALTWSWFLRGRISEARTALAAALALDGGDRRDRARATAWHTGITLLDGGAADRAASTERMLTAFDGIDDPHGLAWAQWFVALSLAGFGDPGAVEHLAGRALATFEELGDRWGAAAALCARAALNLSQGDLAAAERDGARSLEAFRAEGDGWGRIQAAEVLGVLAEARGDYPRAARLHEEGLRLAEELGLGPEVSYHLSRLGRIAMLTGDLDRADDLHRRAAQRAAAEAHRRMEHFAEIGLALTARRRGDLDTAERLLSAWADWVRAIDGAPGLSFLMAERGFIAELRGDADTALRLHEEALTAARATGNPRAVALAQEGLAGAHALAGRAERAARLLGEAAAAREAAGAPLPPAERGDVDRITARAGEALGPSAFETAYRTGFRDGRAAP
ncbi:BTAD domain-containing putative transcriptional regulator [Spirillospora sp. NPDC127200]